MMPRRSFRSLLHTVPARLGLSSLVFIVIAAIALGWVAQINAQDLQARQRQVEQDIVEIKLHDMQGRIEAVFQTMYQNGRTLSLLPGMQAVQGRNRQSFNDDVVASGRFNRETERTVQQIFNNLESNLAVSEVYAVLDGFDATRAEVPFFMFDTPKIAIQSRAADGVVGLTSAPAAPSAAQAPADVPEPVEDHEYAYFPTQLRELKTRYPIFDFASLNDIPAISSSLVNTCDNKQYYSKSLCNESDTAGLLYSIPFYRETTGRFSGLISVILRANVLEAVLVDVPFLVLTPRDEQEAQAKRFTMPSEVSPFALVNWANGVRISDRRNTEIRRALTEGAASEAKLYRTTLRVVDQSPWELHYYLTAQQLDSALAGVRASNASRLWGVASFLLLLYLFSVTALAYQLRASRKLHVMATVDSLTGLPNRNRLLDRIASAIARSKRAGGKTAVFFIDLNKFKAINDSLGHSAGDQVLQEVAQRMQRLAREVDTVGRLGGDEFVMVCEVARDSDIEIIGDRLVTVLRQPIRLGDHDYGMGASVGIAVFPQHAQEAEALLRRADIAMYCAKKDQNAVACLFDESMQDSIDEQLQVQEHLRNGIAAGELVLHFQPQVEFSSGKLMGFEALVRWQSPVYGFMSPARFIPLAEECGLITQIDDWVLDAACAQIQSWRAAGLGDRRVSINLAATKFAAPSFLEDLAAFLRKHGVSPHLLELEITESLAMANPELAIERMQRLRQMQVELAIDDFGTGYSNLSYLSRFPANRLKIDQSFVFAMLQSPQDRALVLTIVELARSLSIRTIAEGVETQEQARALYHMGVHELQGYWISKPLNPSALDELFAKPRLLDPQSLSNDDIVI